MSTKGRKVILTADDFGLSADHNAGIIAAFEHETLATTSLMVGGDAAAEAVDYAHRNPGLTVGLHLTFSDTRPCTPPELIPLLVEANGYLPEGDLTQRVDLRSAETRRQIRIEIAAQFRAFSQTGLRCDHVNSHLHVHRHPLVAMLVFAEAAKWGVQVTRIPWEPSGVLRYARAATLRCIASAYKLTAPDRCIGRAWTGGLLAELLDKLPPGVSELYFHPVTRTDHMFSGDLPALLDPRVKMALDRLAFQSVTKVASLSE
jgi:hopanoid biosynthesis associated protein HpnK